MQTRSQMSARMRRVCAPLLFMLFDYLAILFAEKMAFELHEIYGMLVGRTFHVPVPYLVFWIPLVFIAFLWGMQTYTKMQPILETVRKIFYAVLYAMIACILVLYFMQAGLLASRLYVILFGVLVLFSMLHPAETPENNSYPDQARPLDRRGQDCGTGAGVFRRRSRLPL